MVSELVCLSWYVLEYQVGKMVGSDFPGFLEVLEDFDAFKFEFSGQKVNY